MKNKKLLGVIGLGCSALLLTGCGGKKLTCTMEDEQEGMGTMTMEMVFHFDKEGEKVENLDMEMGIEFDKDIDDEMKEFYESYFEETCEDEDAPEDCKVSTKDNSVTLKASGTPEELDYDSDGNYDEIKEEMEDDGYTCK